MLPEAVNSPYSFASSSVSWGAVAGGGIATAAVTLFLLAFGTGIGFLIVSPWSDQGVSASTFSWSAAVYLVVVAMISSTVGGYLAGRLRTRWHNVHSDEVYFRDTAHGVLTWAFATLLSATVLGAAATHIIAGASAGLAPAASVAGTGAAQSGASDRTVDLLFRAPPASGPAASSLAPTPTANTAAPAPIASATDMQATRAEAGRILMPGLQKGADVSAADRTYLAQLISARTGIAQADAERRVSEVVTQAKQTADDARKAAAKLSLWLAASMLAGALAAALAAVEGGTLRDCVLTADGRPEVVAVPVR